MPYVPAKLLLVDFVASQEALLPQRDRAMRLVSKFVLCFTRYGSWKGFTFPTAKVTFKDIQGH